MRAVFAAAAFALLTGLGACALFSSKPLVSHELLVCINAPASLSGTCNTAADVLNKANVLLASIDTTIKSNVDAKVWPKAVAQGYLDRSKAAGAKLDAAYQVLSQGNFSDALSQANLVNDLIVALQREVAAQAAKANQ